MTLVFYIFCSINLIFAQNTKTIDSLIEVLRIQSDTSKVDTLNELSWELRKKDSKRASQYALTARIISDSLKYINGSLTSLNRLGAIALYKKDIDSAESIYLKVLKEEIKLNNNYGIGRAYNQLGLIYIEKNNLKKALDNLLKAEEKFEELDKRNIIGITSNNIGDLYRRLGDYDNAMTYLIKSLEIKKAQNNHEAIALTQQNIGLFQLELDNYESALGYLNKSKNTFEKLKDDYELAKVYKNLGTTYFQKAEMDSATVYFSKSLSIKEKLKLDDTDPGVHNNLGNIYYKKGLYDKALNIYFKSLKINSTIEVNNNIGHIYYQNKNYFLAIEYYNNALKIADTSGRILEQMDALNSLADTYAKVGNYALSYKFNELHSVLRDSLENEFKQATNLKVNYEEQQKQTALLEKEQAETKRKTILIYSLIGGIVLLTLLFFALLRINKQKQLVRLAEKSQLIESQKVEELLKKQELKSLNAMMIGQEEERRRIARDLHDRLGSMLAMVKNHFKSVEVDIANLKNSNTKLYKKANILLDEACEEVRKISQDMTSGVLTKFGLIAALEDLKDTLLESKRLDVEFMSHGFVDRLPLNFEITVYRIFQELISNVLKHANATELSMQILKGKDLLNIIVEDDGKGFDPKLLYSGMGIKNIESRVDSFGGDLRIDSSLFKGTIITIDFSLKKIYKDD